MSRIRITPEVGRIYENEGGGTYKCIDYDGNTPIMQNVKSGWTMHCHGVGQYENGTIDWDYSTGGYFDEN